MIKDLPAYIVLTFILTTIFTVWLFVKATSHKKLVWLIIIVWLIVQGLIGSSKFYTITDTVPPRFILLVLPPLLLIAGIFLTRKGKRFTDNLDVKWLTYMHAIRIPVEIVLFWLFMQHQVPRLMTFEGRNLDILSGLTAPVVAYYGYTRYALGRTALLIWNFICLGLLANIVVNAVLSMPFAFQQFAFDQPDTALLYFPFIWLPCCIVPLVLYAHLAAIRQLIYNQPPDDSILRQ